MLSFLDKIPFGTPRLRRIVFWLLTTFVAYTLVGFLIVPPIVKKILETQLSEGLKRPAHVQDVSFNPYVLALNIDGLKVDKLEGDGELLSIDSLDVSPSLWSIWELAPVISYLRLNTLQIDITFFGDGKYSISDLLGASNATEPKEEDEEAEGTVFPFALYGFEMTNSTIVFDDRPHDKKHVISDLFLRVPFTSSFTKLKKEFTQPKFTAVVNGDPVELKGRTLPFDETLRTEFELGAEDIDLDRYWTYLPLETPLKLTKGLFTSDISLIFERPDAQRMNLFLGGGGSLKDMELKSPTDGSVLSLKELSFEMEKFSLGDSELILTDVTMSSPFFKVIRHKDDSINWTQYFPGSEMAEAGPKVKAKGTDDAELSLDIRKFQIKDGALEWIDQAVPGGFKRKFSHFAFSGTEISTHGERPSVFEASIGKERFITLKGVGTMKPLGAQATLTIKDMLLTNFKPYLAQVQPMSLDSGTIGLSANIDFRAEDQARQLIVNNGRLTLNDLAMRKPDAKEPSIGLTSLDVNGTAIDLNDKILSVGQVTVTGPMVKLVKEKNGEIDLVSLFATQPNENEPQTPPEPPVARPGDKQWEATVAAVHVKDGAVSFKDMALKHPASLDFDGLELDLGNITTKKDAQLTYTLTSNWGGRGSLTAIGKAELTPLKTNGRIRVNGIGLRPLDGHLGEHTELLFASGSVSANLAYTFKGGDNPRFTLKGDTALNRVRLKDNRGDGEFAGIEKLQLAGIELASTPYRLSIAEIHLDKPSVSIDYDKNGHSNIRRAFRIPEPPPAKKEDPKEIKKQAEKAAKKGTDAPTEVVDTAPKPKPEDTFFNTLDIGKIIMTDGHIRFRDASVKPPYYTEISSMNLGLIEIDQAQSARPKMDFKAKIGPTPISILGVLNPITVPIYSDLAISVNGMELVPLSPYTVENLAYPVEKGRLYADVKFKTEDWVLNADNKFFIEQLVLGPKDKRPDAPDVPIKFGLALLQDGKGNMEIDLPIRGRLDDPDFRIGGIVFKAITRLMFKALASPFTMIGSIFGGGRENMDFVVFEPGRHQLGDGGRQKLETVAKALSERDRLTLEVDGVIDPIADRNGLVEVIFENKLKQQKYDSLSRKERAETTVDAMVIEPEEYGDILYEAYADEPDPDDIKPTTLFMTDRQPDEFMEKFIIERIKVGNDDLNELARLRAASVKDEIIAKDEKLAERVFLLDRRKDKKGKKGVPMHRADLGIK